MKQVRVVFVARGTAVYHQVASCPHLIGHRMHHHTLTGAWLLGMQACLTCQHARHDTPNEMPVAKFGGPGGLVQLRQRKADVSTEAPA